MATQEVTTGSGDADEHAGAHPGIPEVARHHLGQGAHPRAAGQDRGQHRRQFFLLLQPGLPRVPEVRHRDAGEPGPRVGRRGLDVPGPVGPHVHRLPRRVRHLQRGHPAPQDRSGRARPARPDAALVPGAARSAARRARASSSARSRRATCSTRSSSTTAPTPSRARSSSRACYTGQARTSSARSAASTARAAARCRFSANGSTASPSCRSCPASTSSSSATRTP